MATKRTHRKVTLTKDAIAKLATPEKGRAYHYDTRQPSLAVCVLPSGKRTFYLVRWANGVGHKIRIGPFPGTTVEQARRKARKLSTDLDAGVSPNAERRAVRQGLTLQALFDDFLELHAKPHKRTWPEDKRQFDSLLTALKGRKLSAIKRTDLANLHAKVGKKHGHYAANRMLSLIRKVFNFAESRGWEGRNPATGIQRFKEKSRDRFLSRDELRRFLMALADEPDELFRDFFLTLLFTGARRGNVQAMAWDDLSLDRGLWRIPDEKSKSGDVMLIVLVPEAVQILERRAETANGSPWVFPAHSRTGHVVEPRKAWLAILERAEITDFHIHDLRRTLGSWLASAGVSLPIIGKALGHKSLAATQVYARLDTSPVRDAVEATTATMLSTTGMNMAALTGGASDED